MGLFRLRDDKTAEELQQERLYQARNAYDDRRKAFRDAGDTVELDCKEGQDWLHVSCVRLRVDADAFALFPEVNVYDFTETEAIDRLTEIRLPRTAYRLDHESPERQIVREQGDRIAFQWPQFEVTLSGPQSAVLSSRELHRACTFFAKYPDLLSVHSQFDLWDGPAYGVVFSRKDAADGDPAGRYDIWREDQTLYLYQQPGLYARKAEFLEVRRWPLSSILYFRQQGSVSNEYITSGGDLEFDHLAAWRPHLTQVGFLEDAVSVTPVRTQRIEHDERYVELVLSDHRALRLSYDSLDSLRQLIPEKEFEKLALQAQSAPQVVQGREPTPVEQLKILADLVDRGYLTRDEYDAAKSRLLAKL